MGDYVGTIVGGAAGFIIGGPEGAMIGASLGSGFDSARAQNHAFDMAYMDAKQAKELARQELEFDKQKYNEWENTFGPLGENLHDYYTHLNPDQYEARIASSIMGSINPQYRQVNKTLAARGLANSGLADYAKMAINHNAEAQLANAPMQALNQALKQKQAFVNIGLGNKTALNNNLSSATAQAMNNLAYSQQQNLMHSQLAGQSLINSLSAAGYMYGRMN